MWWPADGGSPRGLEGKGPPMLHTATLRAWVSQPVTVIAETNGDTFSLSAYRDPPPGEDPDPDGANDLFSAELPPDAVRALQDACARHLASLG